MEPMNYTLGRGEIYFNKFKPGTQVGTGERYIGNTPEISLTNETENLDHYNSDRGVREKDASVVLQTNRSGSFTTDHISPENLALFFFGSTSALTQTAATSETEVLTNVQQGRFYQLGESPANPTGIRNLTSLEVTDSGSTTYELGTDYMVDMELGRIEILEGGGIDNDTDITVTYDADASTRELVLSGATPIEGSMRYISRNAAGEQLDYYWPWVKLSPNGDFALKGDEWQTIPFSVEVLRRAGYESLYISTRGKTV